MLLFGLRNFTGINYMANCILFKLEKTEEKKLYDFYMYR
jgi:hypothetical protein